MSNSKESLKKERWDVEGYDTFSRESYSVKTGLTSYNAALECAKQKLLQIERTQPRASSGGPDAFGIQDRVFIVHPDGKKDRVDFASLSVA